MRQHDIGAIKRTVRGRWAGLVLLATTLALTPNRSLYAADRAAPSKRTADEVLLVYNANSPISKAVADDYADRRKVTDVLAIRCVDSALETANETVPMKVYADSIERPVREYLRSHRKIQFIVLTKGVPIRISGAPTGERDEHSGPDTPLNACVDSQLAAIDYKDIRDAKKIGITGSGATGVGWINRYWNANEPFSHETSGGYLVTRLDGYTEADAKSLVARAMAAERDGMSGSVLLDVQPIFGLGKAGDQPAKIDAAVIRAESPYSDYNADMRLAHDHLKQRGIADELDLAETFVGGRSGLAGYVSWGSNDKSYSARAYRSLRFGAGSIAETAVSTSGRTFLPTTGGQSLIADLISHGLTCGKGYTDEPLLQAIASPTILFDRYTSGYSMAESFYAASHFVGWTDIIIGDPLCSPMWKEENAK